MLSPQRKEIEHLIDDLLSDLPLRSRDVLEKRFGLQMGKNKETLESIGRFYNITRERVRQIENNALRNIRKSEVFANEQVVFAELQKVIDELGGVVAVGAADDEHHVRLKRHFLRRLLPLLGGLAHGVHKPHF